MARHVDQKPDSKPEQFTLTRRQFLPLLGVAAAAAAAPGPVFAEGKARTTSHATARYVYVGTYTAPAPPPGGTHPSVAQGIYVFRLEPTLGGLTLIQVMAASNPSYLALNSAQTRLYSVNENTAGRVAAYSISPTTGMLTLINSAAANGQDTTHLTVHPSGQYLMSASYSSGQFGIFKINADGSIGTQTANFQSVSNGTGANPDRQEAAHAHQILTDLDGNHVFAVDLGADKVNVLNLDLTAGTLSANTAPFANVASGSGSRHMAFHPNRRRAYVLNELASSISVFAYDPVRGALVWLQTIDTLPDDYFGTNTTAEIRIHPSGKFLYNTNRGHNSISKFKIDQSTGELVSIGWESTGGEWPRGMNIDPSGTFLYAANQNTDTIVVFSIKSNGDLQPTGAVVNTPTPVDIAFGAPV